MQIIEVATGLRRAVIISRIEDDEYKVLTKSRYSFAWKTVRKEAIVYKLQIEGGGDMLGVMALVEYSEEHRVEIRLLASSKENIGTNKIYNGIAGCLIAFAGRMAVDKFGRGACVSLIPKTELKQHYMQRYYMMDAGWQLYLDQEPLAKLINEYFYER
jgi:hypothetical protein